MCSHNVNNFLQFPLPLVLPEQKTFDNFYPGKNLLLIAAIHKLLKQNQTNSLYFWSHSGSGRTHLLYASCNYLSSIGKTVSYIPLEKHHCFTTEIMEGMEKLALICLDNIDSIAGNLSWELALFHLYNRILDIGRTRVIITGNCPPKQLHTCLPDLASRLEWGEVYKLSSLADEDKLRALQLRSHLRGFNLPDDVGLFLLKRLNREMSTLFKILDQLDKASISEQHKLTIPFVKKILSL